MAGFECYYIVDFGCTLILIHLPFPLPIHLGTVCGEKKQLNHLRPAHANEKANRVSNLLYPMKSE